MNNSNKILNCCICSEILNKEFPQEYKDIYYLSDRLCLDSKNFVVYPSVSPITEGHILIFPKQHYNAMLQLPKEYKNELRILSNDLIIHMTNKYLNSFIFEHGAITNNSTNCGISHAHLHIVPIKQMIIKKIESKIKEKYSHDLVIEIDSASKVDIKCDYLLWGRDLNKVSVLFSNNIQSQLIRRVIFNELNKEQWDWKELFGKEDFLNTYKVFH